MLPVLLNPDSPGPAVHYYMIRGGSDKGNITVWESGKVGHEYIKALGHYHVHGVQETYRVLSGEGILLMQWRKKDASGNEIDDQIEKFVAKKMRAGDSVAIPPGAGHLMINTGNSWLVTLDDSPVDFTEQKAVSMPGHANYEPFKKLHGAAYYIVEKDGMLTLEKNPNYSEVPEAELE